ncbi:hypothetical protein HII31_13370 [Pseudocercospora fuligena]|uniref:Uncharacterized protein n=1 Tax=Pseudocercospora fuligena TaxID=685502 RepID=A0A8H6R678_9PEZI|nr:hypothetical protein HII31_13370 [Pseudocercospora fuligena]
MVSFDCRSGIEVNADSILRALNIASLITPATLSVQSMLYRNHSLLEVPKFGFTTLNFIGSMQQMTGGGNFSHLYQFNGPSPRVQRIATAVAGIGEVLPIKPPAPNTSWTLDVWAPTMQCNEVFGEERDQIWTNIWNSIDSTYGGNCDESYSYLSWIPCALDSQNASLRSILPFSQGSGYESEDYSAPGFCGNETLSFDREAVALYVATLPSIASATFWAKASVHFPTSCAINFPGNQPACNLPDVETSGCFCPYRNTSNLHQHFNYTTPDVKAVPCPGYSPSDFFRNASLTSCKYFNTSLSLNFSYPNGTQVVEVRKGMEPPVPIVNSAYRVVVGPGNDDLQTSSPSNNPNCSVLVLWSQYANMVDAEQHCTFDPSVARQLSYQGIISAFNRLILGFGEFKTSDGSGLDIGVLSTILTDTEELAFLHSGDQTSKLCPKSDLQNLQNEVSDGTQWAYRGLANPVPHGTRGYLRDALEGLFQNFTISLLADPYLQPNYSSPFAPERLTNVTSELTMNIYVYASTTLWVAYGLAIFFASLIVAFGATFMVVQNASYNSDFSTIFRASRSAEINVEFLPEDARAQEPLPKRLARARVRFDRDVSTEDEEKEEPTVATQSLLEHQDGDSQARRSEEVPGTQATVAARHTV